MKVARYPGKPRNFFSKIAGAAASLTACAAAAWIASTLPASAQQSVNGVNIFPPNNVWNLKIDTLPVDKKSATYVSALNSLRTNIHPDFGDIYGIPYTVVTGGVPVTQTYNFDYDDECDPGPYPQITNPTTKIEGGWGAPSGDDRHILFVNTTNYILYELYNVRSASAGQVTAGSGAIFPLSSNALRPDTWTSADAAGLPIFPGLVNYAEASAGPIKHAFRFTGKYVNGNPGHIWPARHSVGGSNIRSNYPPFGQRFRLKSSFNVNAFTNDVVIRRILTALKEYGMFYADIGTSWYISGTEDPNWNNADVDALKNLKGSDFEAVDESAYMVSPDSALAALSIKKPPTRPPIPGKPWPTFK